MPEFLPHMRAAALVAPVAIVVLAETAVLWQVVCPD